MHRIALPLVALTLAAASLTTGALAQAQAEPNFSTADADKNGEVSMGEMLIVMPTATQDQFTSADTDKSSGLNQTEFGSMASSMKQAK